MQASRAVKGLVGLLFFAVGRPSGEEGGKHMKLPSGTSRGVNAYGGDAYMLLGENVGMDEFRYYLT